MGSLKQYLLETHDLSQQLDALSHYREDLTDEELDLCDDTRLKLVHMFEIDRTVFTQIEQICKRVVPASAFEERYG